MLFLKVWIPDYSGFSRVQEQRVKHFGEFQRVQRFHMGLSLTSKGTAHSTFTFVVLQVYHGRGCFESIRYSLVTGDDQTTTL